MTSARAENCTGRLDCSAALHVHGCYADFGTCDSPQEHQPRCDRCDTTFAPYYFGSHHQPSCPYYAPPAIPKGAEAHDARFGHGAG